MSENPNILDVTENDFDREVIRASHDAAVLVDFWADWCQPCRMLAPVLEQLAAEHGEGVRIAKVNTDENPGLASRLGIRSLPTVKLYRHGEPVDEFSGVQPLAAGAAVVRPPRPRASDAMREQAAALAAAGDRDGAITVLRQARESDPEDYRVCPDLVGYLIEAGRNDEADELIKSLPANVQQQDDMVRLNARLGFARIAEQAGEPDKLEDTVKADPDDLDARYQLGALKVVRGEYEEAMDQFLEIIRRDRAFGDDAGRRALVDVFALLNNEGELVKKYRRLLASAIN